MTMSTSRTSDPIRGWYSGVGRPNTAGVAGRAGRHGAPGVGDGSAGRCARRDRSGAWSPGDRDDQTQRGVRRRERGALVVDEAGRLRGIDDVHVAQRPRGALARDDPDRAVRPDPRRQIREALEGLDQIGAEQDDVGVGLGPALGQVGRALADLRSDVRVVDIDERDAHAGPDAELVEQRCGVDALHRRYRAMSMLLVYGPRSTSYDFGPGHPLTPRRFGPGIDLLRAVGAQPGLAPEPATDDELRWCHDARYLEVVKRFSEQPFGGGAAGIGEGGDDPPFAGMHEAAASVAGGSIRAMEAILGGDVEHAFQPGGGLHHAMPGRASGFCIYDDPALAIARARRDGLRVLYVDLDVHHGDGVQAIHWPDPDVLTLSFHETGRYLFPGTGGVGELGEGVAAGTAVNVPFEPDTGEGPWLAAVRALLPELAAAFGPDVIVSQHGADSHAWDPLAHLRVTTTAMGEAARFVDLVAHRYAGGRWLATGGGGYDVYRVVPRSWSLVWLAGAHRDVPAAIPPAWRERWSDEALRYGQAPLPDSFVDPPNAGEPVDTGQAAAEARSDAIAALVRRIAVPRLLREARDRGWWDPLGEPGAASGAGTVDGTSTASVIPSIDREAWDRLTLARGVVAPGDPAEGHALIAAGLADGLRATVAIEGTTVVGAAVSRVAGGGGPAALLALGVAPGRRRRGLATTLLGTHVSASGPDAADGAGIAAEVTVGERDPHEPLDGRVRREIARRLLGGAGFEVSQAEPAVRAADPDAIAGIRIVGSGRT